MKKKNLFIVATILLFLSGSMLFYRHYDEIKKSMMDIADESSFQYDMMSIYQQSMVALANDVGVENVVEEEAVAQYQEALWNYNYTLKETPMKYYGLNTQTGEVMTNFEKTDLQIKDLLEDERYFTAIEIDYNDQGHASIFSSRYGNQHYYEKKLENLFTREEGTYFDHQNTFSLKNCRFIFAIEQDQLSYFTYHLNYNDMSMGYFSLMLIFGAILVVIYTWSVSIQLETEAEPYRSFKDKLFECNAFLWMGMLVFTVTMIMFLGTASVSGEFVREVEKLRLNGPWTMSIINISLWFIYFYLISFGAFLVKYVFKMGFVAYIKKNTLLGKIAIKIKDNFEYFLHLDLQNQGHRLLVYFVLGNMAIMMIFCSFFVFGWILCVIYAICLFIFLRKKTLQFQIDYQILRHTIHALSQGNFDMDLEEDLGFFNPIKEELAHLRDGFEKAVNEEVKSQKTKTELISHVSHDLKTPLTSLISYVDLLKDPQLDEQTRQSYIEVLERNTLRLKKLIEDLFEVSKVNSGDVSLDIVDVDLGSLILQTYYECQDALEEKGLDVRFNISKEKHIYPLDSLKTYRIFENIFINISKYALENTRVYVDMKDDGQHVCLEFKNISKEEMHFDQEEIMHRFVRGDQARSGQGSGLGLAIVKSFTEVQKGKCQITIDGDLFKISILFNKETV